MKLSKIVFCIVIVLVANILYAQPYNVNLYFGKLKNSLKTLQDIDSEVKNYCENNQQNINSVASSLDVIELGFENYSMNDISSEYYDGFQNLDYIEKCRLLYSWNQISTTIYGIASDKKIPIGISYLPVVLTALDSNDSAGKYSLGIWGLPYLPAVKNGIVADSCYDQRLDISLNTFAALSYLDELHQTFKTWDFAITAYCCGPSSVVRAGFGDLPFDSVCNKIISSNNDSFYRLIAFAKWMEENETLDFSKFAGFSVSISDTVIINSRIHFKQIAEVLGINYYDLRNLNPLFTGDVIDGRKKLKVLNIPENFKSDFIVLRDSIEDYKDSLYFPKYVPVVPQANDYEPYVHVSVSPGDGFEEIKYKIVSGDNLGAIAQRYGVNVVDLKDWNGIRGTNIYAGQTISIWVKEGTKVQIVKQEKEKPVEEERKSVTSHFPLRDYDFIETYEVKSGDSPYKIAQNYSWASPEDIMDWNGVTDPSKLRVGQKLKIYKKKK